MIVNIGLMSIQQKRIGYADMITSGVLESYMCPAKVPPRQANDTPLKLSPKERVGAAVKGKYCIWYSTVPKQGLLMSEPAPTVGPGLSIARALGSWLG